MGISDSGRFKGWPTAYVFGLVFRVCDIHTIKLHRRMLCTFYDLRKMKSRRPGGKMRALVDVYKGQPMD